MNFLSRSDRFGQESSRPYSSGAIALAVMVFTVFQAVMVGFTGELYKLP
jgi:ABC-type lipoprotein release transport system permease subunit